MRCDDVHALIDLYLDDELDGIDRAEIEGHAAMCGHCASLLARQTEFKAGLRALASEDRIDAEFASRLNVSLTRAAVAQRSAQAPTSWHPVALAAAAAAVLAVAVPGTMFFAVDAPAVSAAEGAVSETSVASPEALEVIEDSVRWHSRPLPVEVTGPSHDDVAAWFRGKVDFPVAPPAFERRAYLLGARIGNVRQRDAALLVYDVEGRRMSVMMFDASGSPLPTGAHDGAVVSERAGYRVALRERDGVAYSFTSDLPGHELAVLVDKAFAP